MTHHLVVGVGPIGQTLTLRPIERGNRVTLATRSGTAMNGAQHTANAQPSRSNLRSTKGALSIRYPRHSIGSDRRDHLRAF